MDSVSCNQDFFLVRKIIFILTPLMIIGSCEISMFTLKVIAAYNFIVLTSLLYGIISSFRSIFCLFAHSAVSLMNLVGHV